MSTGTKTRPLNNQDGVHGGHIIECPACKEGHLLDTRWQFNGDVHKPTFSPSLKVTIHDSHGVQRSCCHSFIRDGKIEFCSDSTHSLAGQTVDLPDLDLWKEEPKA